MFIGIIGFLIGIIPAMGTGGGAILIPALVLLCGVSQQTAQGINLVYFLPTAIASLIIHIKNKNVEIKTAAIIGISGVIGAIGGTMLAVYLSGEILKKLFASFLFLIGIYEVYKGIKSKNQANA